MRFMESSPNQWLTVPNPGPKLWRKADLSAFSERPKSRSSWQGTATGHTLGRLIEREGICPCCRTSRPPTNQCALPLGTTSSIMIFLNFGHVQRQIAKLFVGRSHTRITAHKLVLEPLEKRELLDGSPLVNAQSTTQQLFVESLFKGL